MLQDTLSFLRRSLFGRAQCEPTESQLPGKKEAEAAGTCRGLQTAVHVKTTNSSDGKGGGSGGNAIPKKTTVLIMVAPPTDLQQVGEGRWLYSAFPVGLISRPS